MSCKIMFVDDEKSILSALKRIFADYNYNIYTANSGREALEILKKEQMDIIVSDQRMPEMSGVEFLQQAKLCSPGAIRMLLTGYSDINAVIDSINKCDIFKYITKPWNNDELIKSIQYAVELKKLRKENCILHELTDKQNIELKELNSNLEKKVNEQTEELRMMLDKSKVLYKKLSKSFFNTIRVFINMIKLRNPELVVHLKNTAGMAKNIAQRMNLDNHDIKDIEIAALLHDIGKMGASDELLNKPFGNMTTSEKAEYKKHPTIGQAALKLIENFNDIGIIVRHHHEEWNGHGFPDKLKGNKIPIGARIIGVAGDYDSLSNGTLLPAKLSMKDACNYIIKNSNQRYDPDVVAIFVSLFKGDKFHKKQKPENRVPVSELKQGMVLAKDIFTNNGFLLLEEGTKITIDDINNIADFEKAERKIYSICVEA